MNTYQFICDQMLLCLGKWLRAAGYDTQFSKQRAPYKQLLQQCAHENRLFLTCNQHLLQIKEFEPCGIYLQQDSLTECIRQINHKLQLNWLYKPFSRCLICNSLLLPLQDTHYSQLPPNIDTQSDRCVYCPCCNKIYWMGSHTKRMYKKLLTWQKMKHDLLI